MVSGPCVPGGLGPRWEAGLCLRNTLVCQKVAVSSCAPRFSPVKSPERGFRYGAANYARGLEQARVRMRPNQADEVKSCSKTDLKLVSVVLTGETFHSPS